MAGRWCCVTSIAVDFWRSRQLRAVAVRTGSPALATDAFHFASDIWATLAVLAGLGVNWVGAHFGIRALHYADPCAAIVVSLMILRMTIRLGHEAVGALVDEIPAETRRQLVREVERVDGVLAVEQARVRRAGAGYFADLTLALPRRFTFEHTGELVQAATAAVHRVLPAADVVIHTVPRETRAESIFDRVRAVAARNNVSVHELSIQIAPWHVCTSSCTSRSKRTCRSARRTASSPHSKRRFCATFPRSIPCSRTSKASRPPSSSPRR